MTALKRAVLAADSLFLWFLRQLVLSDMVFFTSWAEVRTSGFGHVQTSQPAL